MKNIITAINHNFYKILISVYCKYKKRTIVKAIENSYNTKQRNK